MQHIARKMGFLVAVLICALALSLFTSPRANSQTGGQYDLVWNTIDGGGLTFATGGAYELGGTVGQADAGNVSGGNYSLDGGFWAVQRGVLYLPIILR